MTFYRWMDKLGVAAQEGLGVIMRQTFYGYYYALIDSNLEPNPVMKGYVKPNYPNCKIKQKYLYPLIR